jgi:hypothetical protein
VHVGVLAQVDGGEVEAEHPDGAPQRAQAPAGERRRAVRHEGAVDHVEVGEERVRRLVGRRLPDRVAGHLAVAEGLGGRGEAGVEARDGAPVGLVLPVRGAVGRALGELLRLVGDADDAPVEGELAAEPVQLVEVVREGPLALELQGLREHVGGHEGVAVAVAADPAAHAQEGRQLGAVPGGVAGGELVLEGGVEARQLGQEGVVVIREAVHDLVDHLEAGAAQDAGLPEGQDGAAQAFLVDALLLGRQADAVALGEELGDLHLAVDGGAAAHLGRVRGQDRADQGRAEEAQEVGPRQPGGAAVGERRRHGAGARRRAGARMGAGAAHAVLVLGDVGEVREVAEGADDLGRAAAGERVQRRLELGAGGLVLVAVEADRGLADALDDVVHDLALLEPHRVAEEPPEQPDVVAQRQVLVGSVERGHGQGPGCGARPRAHAAPHSRSVRRGRRIPCTYLLSRAPAPLSRTLSPPPFPDGAKRRPLSRERGEGSEKGGEGPGQQVT